MMQPNLQQLTRTLQHIVNQTRFSGVISIKADGALIFEQAYGLADRSHLIPNTLETRGHILLGLVIEAISGQAYTDFIQRDILERCGMHDSGYFAMDQLPERTATGYIDANEGWRSNMYHLPAVGAADGGVYATVRDIHKSHGAMPVRRAIDPFLWYPGSYQPNILKPSATEETHNHDHHIR